MTRKNFLILLGILLSILLLCTIIYIFINPKQKDPDDPDNPVDPDVPSTDCSWVTGVWAQCKNGKQIRPVSCQNNKGICDNKKCTSNKPSESKICTPLKNCCDYSKAQNTNCTANTPNGCPLGSEPIDNCDDCKQRIFPPNVYIFSPEQNQQDIQDTINTVFKTQGGVDPENNGQFSDQNAAFLFMPGKYKVEIPIGYYTHVAGLGKSMEDVTIQGGPNVNNGSTNFQVGSLNNFWRTCENMTVTKPFTSANPNQMIFAVSQATSLRSVHVQGNLSLGAMEQTGQMGYASGGFMANCKVDGELSMGSQQQFICRNTEFDTFPVSLWNQVNVGCISGTQKVETCCINTPKVPVNTSKNLTVVENTPLVAEKPYLAVSNNTDKSSIIIIVPSKVPNRKGVLEQSDISINSYTIITPKMSGSSINKLLKTATAIIFSPGRYNIEEPIILSGQLLFGLGLPVLKSVNNNDIITGYGDICGVIFEAGIGNGSNTLLNLDGQLSNLWDICCRVGGGVNNKDKYSIDTMLKVGGNNSILDNVWCWVADHYSDGGYTGWDNAACNTGVHVTGSGVTAYGLFSEHNHDRNVRWDGDNGQVYMFQSEFNYFPPSQQIFSDAVSYEVAENVTNHTIIGAGAYSFFPLQQIFAKSGFRFPDTVNYKSILTVFLNGKGGITNVINDKGITVQNDGTGTTGKPSPTQIAFICNKEGTNSDCPCNPPCDSQSTCYQGKCKPNDNACTDDQKQKINTACSPNSCSCGNPNARWKCVTKNQAGCFSKETVSTDCSESCQWW
jgi:hypothetical protein